MEIAVLGSVNADIVYDVSRLPLAGETLVADARVARRRRQGVKRQPWRWPAWARRHA